MKIDEENGSLTRSRHSTLKTMAMVGGAQRSTDNVDSDVKRESERANALRAVLWIDKHNPNVFIP